MRISWRATLHLSSRRSISFMGWNEYHKGSWQSLHAHEYIVSLQGHESLDRYA